METIITKKTAKLAKNKGFNIPCWGYINIHGELDEVMGYIGDNFEEKWEYAKDFVDYYLPSQSVLQSWLLEKHGLFINVDFAYNEWGRYSAGIYRKAKDGITAMLAQDGLSIFDNPKDAYEEGLFEALSLVV